MEKLNKHNYLKWNQIGKSASGNDLLSFILIREE